MSDITHNLLTQYYGIGVQSNSKKSVALYECMYDSEDTSEDVPLNQSCIDPNEDNASKQTDVAEGNVDSDKRNSIYDTYIRSSRVLEINSSDEENESSKSLEGFLKPNVEYNPESPKLLPAKETWTDKMSLDPADQGANSSNHVEEIIQDNVSDISSVVSKKKTRKSAKSFTISLPPPPRKAPVCNETFMDMADANLIEFPIKILDKFSSLRMIYLENNELTELPENLFSTLRNLEWLDVRNNQIIIIPVTIKYHPTLETMLLQGNKIDTLPIELCTLPKLQTIQVANNPLVSPPQDVVAAGSKSILNFLSTEWNKQHPEEIIEAAREIQPKPSTILCYQSPREKNKRKIKGLHISKDFKLSVRERRKLYTPSNRYGNASSNCVDDKNLCHLCIENLANINLSREKSLITDDDENSKTTETMQLQQLSPGSLYVRRNVANQTFIRTGERSRYFKLPALEHPVPKISFRKSDSINNGERTFDIVTKNRKLFKLRPINLDNSKSILAFLENYMNVKRGVRILKKMLQKPNVYSGCQKSRSSSTSKHQSFRNLNSSTLKAWRRDKKSFNISMGKAAKRNQDDIPFATDIVDSSVLSRLKSNKRSGLMRQRKSGFVPPKDINKKINELLENLNNMELESSSDGKTPRSKQMLITNEIEKMLLLQSEVEDLRRYNDMTMALAK